MQVSPQRGLQYCRDSTTTNILTALARENVQCWWIAPKEECLSLSADNGFYIGGGGPGDGGLEFNMPDDGASQDRCSYFETQNVCQRDASCVWTENCISVASLAESETSEGAGVIPPTRSPAAPEPTSLSPTTFGPTSLNPTQLQPVPTLPPTTLKPTSSSPTTPISATNIEQSRDPDNDEETEPISQPRPAPEEGHSANDSQLSLPPEEEASAQAGFGGGDGENVPQQAEVQAEVQADPIPDRRYTVLYSIEIKPWNVQNDWIPPSWNRITEEHIHEHSIEMIKDEDPETHELLTNGEGSNLSVSIIIDSAKLTSTSSLKVNFYTAIAFQSRKSDWDADGIVARAFDSLLALNEYVQKLNDDPLLAGVQSVDVNSYSVEGFVSTEELASKAAPSGSRLYATIIGLVGLSCLSI